MAIRRHSWSRWAVLTAALLMFASGAAASAEPPPANLDVGAALAQLEALPIKGRAPKTGYDREQFGPAWSDDVTVPDGHNGCDTRNDILRRDLIDVVIKPGTNGCVVLSGVLNDPYTGSVIDFQRGHGTSRAVQIDHVVPLSDAWQKGAQGWDEDTRRNFANDPMNLQATSGPVNEQKGDGDAATWLPPNKAYRQEYAARIIAIKHTYGLWVTQAEHDALAWNVTAGHPAPTDGPPPPAAEPAPPPTEEPAPPSSEAVAPFAAAPPPAETPAYFPNCRAARAAGAAPLHAGDPGYRSGLDRDGDGVACE